MAFELQSPAFPAGGEIPVKHTCDGADVSPPLRWSDPPAETKGFVLIMDDPDAPVGTWVHWVFYGLAATVRELPEGVPARDTLAGIGTQGVNDFRKVGYGVHALREDQPTDTSSSCTPSISSSPCRRPRRGRKCSTPSKGMCSGRRS